MKELKLIQQDLSKIDFSKIDLSKIESVLIWECKKIDLKFLENCIKLQKLRMSDYPYNNLLPINKVKNLKCLELVGVENNISLNGLESLVNLKVLEISTPVHWDFSKGKKVSILDIDILKKLKLESLSIIGFDIEGYNHESFVDNFDIPNLRIGGNIKLKKIDGVIE